MERKLTHKEEQVMQIFWQLKKALIKEVINEMPEPRPPYTTVASTVRKLTEEGFLAYKAFGTTYQYYPILKKASYRKMIFKQMITNYFESSPEQVISHFIKEEKLDPKEMQDWFDKLKKKNK